MAVTVLVVVVEVVVVVVNGGARPTCTHSLSPLRICSGLSPVNGMPRARSAARHSVSVRASTPSHRMSLSSCCSLCRVV